MGTILFVFGNINQFKCIMKKLILFIAILFYIPFTIFAGQEKSDQIQCFSRNNSGKLKLDSVVQYSYQRCWGCVQGEWSDFGYFLDSKAEYIYHTNNFLQQTKLYYFNEDSLKSIIYGRADSTFDYHGNLLQYIGYDWNIKENNWKPVLRNDSEYNSENKIILKTDYKVSTIDGSYQFTKKNWIEYSYTEKGLISMEKRWVYNKSKEEWEVDQYYEYKYDNYGNIIFESQLREGDIYTDKYEIKYNNSGSIIQCIHYEWDSDNYIWDFTRNSKQYQYDSNGNLLYSSHLDSTENGIEAISPFEEYLYDINGRLTRSISYNCNNAKDYCSYFMNAYSYVDSIDYTIKYDSTFTREIENGIDWGWEKYFLYSYYYDNDGTLIKYKIDELNLINDYYSLIGEYHHDKDSNSITFTRSIKDEEDGQYIYQEKDEKKFDNNDNILEWIKSGWDEDSAKWIVYNYINYYYSEHDPTDANVQTAHVITVYPNPVSGILYLEGTSYIKDYRFDVFNSEGKFVYSSEVNRTYTIDLHSLVSGIYLYRISSDGKYFTGRFIKK